MSRRKSKLQLQEYYYPLQKSGKGSRSSRKEISQCQAMPADGNGNTGELSILESQPPGSGSGSSAESQAASEFILPFGALGHGTSGKKLVGRGPGRPPGKKKAANNATGTVAVNGNGNETLMMKINEIGLHSCPQCRKEYGENCKPIQEACGHIKCRACFIRSLDEGDNYCQQCELKKTDLKILEKRKSSSSLKLNDNGMRITPVSIRVNLANVSNSNSNERNKMRKNNFSQAKAKARMSSSADEPEPVPELELEQSRVASPFPPRESLFASNNIINNNNLEMKKIAPAASRLILNRVQIQTPSPSPSSALPFPPSSLTVRTLTQPPAPRPLVKLLPKTLDGNHENKIPKVTLQIESKDTEGNVSSAKVKAAGSESKKEVKIKRKRTRFDCPHYIDIVGDDPKLYKCCHCDKKFKTKAHIKYHEFCHLPTEKPFHCDQCGQGFIAKSHYEYHLRTHTGEKPYPCSLCGKRFNQRGKVNRHMRSHTGEKPFICQQCGRGFGNTQALRSHFLIHTGERPFPCQYCGKRFTGLTNLKKHVITHTGERPFECKMCGKSFGLKWTLDLHMKTHSTERPHQCVECMRAFTNSKDLRRHLVIHSGERPFKCWVCGTAFRRKDNLDRHIKNTHGKDFPLLDPKLFKIDPKNQKSPHTKSAPIPMSTMMSTLNKCSLSKSIHPVQNNLSPQKFKTSTYSNYENKIYNNSTMKSASPRRSKKTVPVFKLKSNSTNDDIIARAASLGNLDFELDIDVDDPAGRSQVPVPVLQIRKRAVSSSVTTLSSNSGGSEESEAEAEEIAEEIELTPNLIDYIAAPEEEEEEEEVAPRVFINTSILHDDEFLEIKREVRDAEATVEGLVRAGLIASDQRNGTGAGAGAGGDQQDDHEINEHDDDGAIIMKGIFIKQEANPIPMTKPINDKMDHEEMNMEMEPGPGVEVLVESFEGVTVVHEEDGSTHVLL